MNAADPEGEQKLAICAGCSCLCDDIIVLDGLPELPECEVAKTWFDTPSPRMKIYVEGENATLNEAIDRAGNMLSSANSPLVFGLDGLSGQAQTAAWSVAAALKSCIDISLQNQERAGVVALQTSGKSTATIGEIAQRSKLVILWFTDPALTHPRLFERACRSAREVIVIGSQTDSNYGVDCTPIDLAPADALDALKILNLIVARSENVNELDENQVLESTGQPLETWRQLAEKIQSSHYAAILHGKPECDAPELLTERLYEFVVRVNKNSRFVSLGVGEPLNSTNAEHIISANCGFPFAVNLHPHPQFNGFEYSADRLLKQEAIDCVLISSTLSLKPEDLHGDAALNRIVLTHEPERWKDKATVVISTGVTGLDQHGDWMRMDGVILPMPAVRDSTETYNATDVLTAIAKALKSDDSSHQ
ncbi:MAG: hypothetical protein AAF456_25640 [Planctomycetota bacterium]